jgi:hypothetical protein
MTRKRFPIAASLAALAFGAAGAAHAQQARIDDIQISREGETVSILVKFSQQPVAATAKAAGDDLVIEIDGPALTKLVLDPPPGSLVRHVEAEGKKLTLSGAAFGAASTVIYRNAVLIETRLAEPALRGSSLMAATSPAAPPAPAKPETRPDPPKAPQGLESHPPPLLVAAPKPPAPKLSTTALASIDSARCAAAALDLNKDPWALAALGDHALCLLDAGKSVEAKSRLDQLAAFAPEDWRVALGRATLDGQTGDVRKAAIGYKAAAGLAPDSVRIAITNALESSTGN